MGFPFQYSTLSANGSDTYHTTTAIVPSTSQSVVFAGFSDPYTADAYGDTLPPGWIGTHSSSPFTGLPGGAFFLDNYTNGSIAFPSRRGNWKNYSSIGVVFAANTTMSSVVTGWNWAFGTVGVPYTNSPQGPYAVLNHSTVIVLCNGTTQSGGNPALTAVTDNAGNFYYGPITVRGTGSDTYPQYTTSMFVAVDIPASAGLTISISTDVGSSGSAQGNIRAFSFLGPIKMASGYSFGSMMF